VRAVPLADGVPAVLSTDGKELLTLASPGDLLVPGQVGGSADALPLDGGVESHREGSTGGVAPAAGEEGAPVGLESVAPGDDLAGAHPLRSRGPHPDPVVMTKPGEGPEWAWRNREGGLGEAIAQPGRAPGSVGASVPYSREEPEAHWDPLVQGQVPGTWSDGKEEVAERISPGGSGRSAGATEHAEPVSPGAGTLLEGETAGGKPSVEDHADRPALEGLARPSRPVTGKPLADTAEPGPLTGKGPESTVDKSHGASVVPPGEVTPGVAAAPGQEARESTGIRAMAASRWQELVDQVAGVVRLAREGEVTQARIRLHPPQLGALKVEAEWSGALRVRLEVQNPHALQALESGLSDLRQRLLSQGIPLQELQLTLGGDRGGGGPAEERKGLRRAESPWVDELEPAPAGRTWRLGALDLVV
ncbi:MAG: flagellar hook-length control protein FliK, partial [Candidatus Geothermincolales bacterium]